MDSKQGRKRCLLVDSSDSSEESEEDDLEVLPPVASTAAAAPKPSVDVARLQQHAPRLSASGGDRNDPIALGDDSSDDDDGGEEVEMSLRERLSRKLPPKQNSSRPASSSAKSLSSPESPSPQVVDEAPSHARVRASQNLSSLDFQHSSSDDSDSDSSLKAIKEKIAALRGGRKGDDSRLVNKQKGFDDDDSSDDDDNILRKPAAKKTSGTRNKTGTRKKASAVSKEMRERERLERKQQKEREKREKEEARQQKQQERQLEKEAKEKEKEMRKRARIAKKAAEEGAKIQRSRQREEAMQRNGKHAKREIAVLMERDLFRHARLPLVDDLQEAEYTVQEYPSALGCKAVQWIRKDYLKGGAADALQMLHGGNMEGYVRFSIVTVVFDIAHDFINLLSRQSDDDDYPELENWLRGVEAGWRAAWKAPANERPRLILMLYQVKEALNQLWIDYNKPQRSSSTGVPPSGEELQDAIAWLLIQFQVECVHCSTAEELSYELKKMTRMLSEKPYQRKVAELDCIKKLKRTCSDSDPPYEQARDCWLRQIQQVPQVSLGRARSLTRHYPTAHSLWTAYQDEGLTENEKRLLLADMFGSSRQVKLSNYLYTVMTSEDPDEILR